MSLAGGGAPVGSVSPSCLSVCVGVSGGVRPSRGPRGALHWKCSDIRRLVKGFRACAQGFPRVRARFAPACPAGARRCHSVVEGRAAMPEMAVAPAVAVTPVAAVAVVAVTVMATEAIVTAEAVMPVTPVAAMAVIELDLLQAGAGRGLGSGRRTGSGAARTGSAVGPMKKAASRIRIGQRGNLMERIVSSSSQHGTGPSERRTAARNGAGRQTVRSFLAFGRRRLRIGLIPHDRGVAPCFLRPRLPYPAAFRRRPAFLPS